MEIGEGNGQQTSNFKEFSHSKKSRVVNNVIERAKKLSEDKDNIRSRLTETTNIDAVDTLNSIKKNIKMLYESCSNNSSQKIIVLLLISAEYSYQELSNKEFRVSTNTYYSSKKRSIPPSRSKITLEVIDLIHQHLENHSVSSSISRRRSSGQTKIDTVRHLTNTKKFIFKKLIKDHPDIRIKKSKFYKLIPKTYIKPSKSTDMCNVCVAGDKAKKARASVQSLSLEMISQLDEAIREYSEHKLLCAQQKTHYNSILDGISDESCIIITDFKEYFKIGGGPVEENRVYYNKTSISDLCFCLITRSDRNITRRYYNYLSKSLSHDSNDAGTHFRSNEYIYGVFNTIRRRYPSKIFFLNCFLEFHGKSDVGGHFGTLPKWFYDAENSRYISILDDLINLFEEKTREKEKNRCYFREYKGQNRKTPINNVLKVCPLSTINNGDYIAPTISEESLPDIRGAKTAPTRTNNRPEYSNVLKVCPLSTINNGDYIAPTISEESLPDIRGAKTAPTRTNNRPEYSVMGKNSRNVHNSRMDFIRKLENTN
ncbi:hypothetical protein BB558_003093 [Smittium angustum]|uniref:Uncharacterized protein n=1 Tax=Smittium angustum TaxID=133377 RepID=A0A2U1J787_SMIAN|nr:hypothetical protein BB558_003093 [Smittium angustum]